jgi:uncharacterized protein (TIGR02453 family)
LGGFAEAGAPLGASDARVNANMKKKSKIKIEKTPKFAGFAPGALDFFRKLRNNNHRDWFLKQKESYETTLVAPMTALVFEVAARVGDAGLPLLPKRKAPVMRIYRDIRFSKNKTPYKTHISAFMRREGLMVHSGGLYFTFSDKENYVAAGFWQPEREALHAWRQKIAAKPAEFQKLVKTLKKAGYEFEAEGTLKRLPRGFDTHAGSPHAKYLMFTSFVVMKEIPKAALSSPKLAAEITKFALVARPLLEFGWKIIGTAPARPRID